MIGLARPHVRTTWATPWLEVVLGLTVVAVIFVPAAAARVAPFALFGYGFVGLLVAHHLLRGSPARCFTGLGTPGRTAGRLRLVLPEAFAFMVAALWLLVATGGPGGTAVRRAVRQLLGAGGEQRTVPALLLLPVLGLWEEAVANPLWYGAGSAIWPVFGIAITLAAVVLVVRRPRVAAVVAVVGLIVLGLVLIISAPNGADGFLAYAQGHVYGEHHPGFYPAAPGAFSGMYGPVLLTTHAAVGLTKAEGVSCSSWPAACWRRARSPGRPTPSWPAARPRSTQRVDRLSRTRTDAANTAVAELRRIERDLHDGAQARLVAVGMSLRAAEQLMASSPEAALALVAEARETSSRALDDLRDLVRGIYPPVLADRGLADAVRALALDAPMTVDTDITLAGEPPMPVAAAVYFGIAEALTNAVRHSGADTVQIGIGYAGGLLRATITDDGDGRRGRVAGHGPGRRRAPPGHVRRHPRGQQPARRPHHRRARGPVHTVDATRDTPLEPHG